MMSKEVTAKKWIKSLEKIERKIVTASEHFDLLSELEKTAGIDKKILQEDVELLDRIVWNSRKYGGGAPVIKNTRVPVSTILGELIASSQEEIEEEFKVSEKDIEACLAFAKYLINGYGEGPFKNFSIIKSIEENQDE